MKYTKVYYFNVIDEIKKGKTVYALDKENKVVLNCNDLRLEDALEMISTDNDRFDFWVEENDG